AVDVEVKGIDLVSLLPSAIRSATLSAGDAGVVKIESDRVLVTDGARITALTANSGNAGEVQVTASERITVEGRSPNQLPSLISAASNPLSPQTQAVFNLPDVPSGNSGALTLSAPEILVQGGGLITTNNEGTGNAGTLSIFSDRLIVKNRGQISSTVLTGAGGKIVIDTGDLSLDQGLINASVLATGTGGDIQITAAGTIALTGIPLDLSTLFTEFAQDPLNFLGTSPLANGLITFTGNGGNSGQIDLQAQNLSMDSGAFITTSTVAQGNAGSIRLNIADQIRANNSYVLTTTFNTGNAGDLEVETQSLRTENGGLFATGYFGAGNGGKLTVTATESIDLADDRYGNIRGGFTSGSLLLGDITNPFTIPGNGGDLTVQTPRLSIRNGAALNSSAEGSGNAGNISIRSDWLRLETGGYISSLSTVGRGGDIQITATEAIDILQTDTFPNLSTIQLPLDPILIRQVQSAGITSLSTGQSSGHIQLFTKALTLAHQGLIASASLGAGPGGDFTLQAESVLLDNSYIAASSYAQGDAGNISISSQTLATLGNSLISTFAAAEGNAGNININATDSIQLQGTSVTGELFVIGLAAGSLPGASGSSGTIEIETGSLTLDQNVELSTSALGTGNGGDITINSDRIRLTNQGFISSISTVGNGGKISLNVADTFEIVGTGTDLAVTLAQTPSSRLTEHEFIPVLPNLQRLGVSSFALGGTAGDIALNAQTVRLSQGGSLISSNLGQGGGGTVNVQGREIRLEDGFIVTATSGQGDAGQIKVQSDRLQLFGQATLGTFALGTGNAGDIEIAAEQAVTIEGKGSLGAGQDLAQINGGLFAITQGSLGGNIRISTPDLKITRLGELATSATGQGVAGDINIESDRVVLDQAFVLATSNLGQGGNIQIQAKDWLFFQNGTRLSAQSGTAELGGGNGGNITLESPIILGINNSDLIANAFEGDGGNINIVTQGLLGFTVKDVDNPLADPRNNITASSRFGSSGTTDINSSINPTKGLAPLATAFVDPANAIVDRCAISPNSDGNRFTATGRGGLPVSPVNLPTPIFLITLPSALSPQVADLNDRASLLFEQGDLEAAYATWQEAADQAAAVEDLIGQRSIQLNQLQTLQLLGYQIQTYQVLSSLQTAVAQEPQSLLQAVTGFQRGNSAQSLGKLEEAATALTGALTIAQALPSSQSLSLSSQILLGLGHNARAQNQIEQAIEYYQRAATIAPDSLTKFQAQVSALDLAITEGVDNIAETDIAETGNLAETGQLLSQAQRLLPSRSSFYSQIHLTSLLQRSLTTQSPLATPDQILHSLQYITKQAQTLGDNQSRVYALGAQGELYEQTQQWNLAQQLTQQALGTAQPLNSAEINYLLLWQLGRILSQQGQTPEAIVAYRQAVAALQTIRTEIASNAPDVQFNFRDRVEPLYRQFVRLLLAAETPAPESLKEARNLIENLQLAELNDYFQDACTQATPIAVDQVDPTAAVIYPIILDDRLDVIVSLGKDDHLLHYSHPISAQEVRDAVQEIPKSFAAAFRANSRQTHRKLQQFYDWLIQPAQSQLEAHNIETLVFIPDGALRNLSLSALYTGEHYLIEEYNIALSPGLNLMEPRPLSQRNSTLFAGGLSQVNPDFSGEFNPLPFVEEELAAITTIVPRHREYLNEALVSSVLMRDLKELPFNIVHLATHGEFCRSAEETYLLTWDRKLGLEEFSQLLQESSRIQDPIELLVLSACDTAAGNDRAVLGIAGMAIRSNIRSTIASLRRVDDEATARFMADFYQALVQPGVTKSQAFRQAQLALLRSPLYASPYYWAPFVLVGNWL
ncbi:MAG: hypothetical protein RLZZ435_2456, partial [Cyanobacteriota bacterium]